MEMQVNCECGWSYRGPEDELARAVQQHAREVHQMEVTREQALAQARPV